MRDFRASVACLHDLSYNVHLISSTEEAHRECFWKEKYTERGHSILINYTKYTIQGIVSTPDS